MSHEPPRESATPDEPDVEAPSPEFSQALEQFERQTPAAAAAEVKVGAKVHGRVISIADETLLVDFGGRSEGAAETRQFRNPDGSLRVAVGDEVDLFVVEAGDQILLAPTVRSRSRASLERLRAAQASGAPVTGRITNAFTSGFMVDLSGVRGFCPLSHMDEELRANPSACVGRALDFAVISVGEGRGKVVLSRRRLLREQQREREQHLVESLHAGDERDGTVKRLEPYGAFIDVGGLVGLAHVTELAHGRVGHPSES